MPHRLPPLCPDSVGRKFLAPNDGRVSRSLSEDSRNSPPFAVLSRSSSPQSMNCSLSIKRPSPLTLAPVSGQSPRDPFSKQASLSPHISPTGTAGGSTGFTFSRSSSSDIYEVYSDVKKCMTGDEDDELVSFTEPSETAGKFPSRYSKVPSIAIPSLSPMAVFPSAGNVPVLTSRTTENLRRTANLQCLSSSCASEDSLIVRSVSPTDDLRCVSSCSLSGSSSASNLRRLSLTPHSLWPQNDESHSSSAKLSPREISVFQFGDVRSSNYVRAASDFSVLSEKFAAKKVIFDACMVAASPSN